MDRAVITRRSVMLSFGAAAAHLALAACASGAQTPAATK